MIKNPTDFSFVFQPNSCLSSAQTAALAAYLNHPMHPSRRIGRFDKGRLLAATG